jgi:hypothetical protein
MDVGLLVQKTWMSITKAAIDRQGRDRVLSQVGHLCSVIRRDDTVKRSHSSAFRPSQHPACVSGVALQLGTLRLPINVCTHPLKGGSKVSVKVDGRFKEMESTTHTGREQARPKPSSWARAGWERERRRPQGRRTSYSRPSLGSGHLRTTRWEICREHLQSLVAMRTQY